MSLPAFLLRLLLCATLVLNGSGYAMAATQMQLTHMAATAASEQDHRLAFAAGHDAMPPCHSQEQADHAAPATLHDTGSSAMQHGSPDCCQASLCSCDCLQHASPAMTGLPPPAPERLHAPSTRRVPAGHAAPALANLIRPPIG